MYSDEEIINGLMKGNKSILKFTYEKYLPEIKKMLPKDNSLGMDACQFLLTVLGLYTLLVQQSNNIIVMTFRECLLLISKKYLEGYKQFSKTFDVDFPVADGFVKESVNKITHCAAFGNYAQVFFCNKQKPFLCTSNLKNIERLLKRFSFFRINKSQLINMDFVKEYNRKDGAITLENKIRFDISRRRKDEFVSARKKYNENKFMADVVF